jgi:hypothetical protein
MRAHACFIGALLLIAAAFAEPEAEADCGEWTYAVRSVATAWAASQICPDPIWQKGANLTRTMSQAAAMGIFPANVFEVVECRTSVETIIRRNAAEFRERPEACEGALEFLTGVKPLRDRLLGLGLIKVN